MAKTRGTGLLMVWVDVDPEYEAELHRWYDEEHIQRLLSVPGFRSAGRYVALKGGPKNLVLYELEGLPMREVAEAIGCPLQTAYSRLHAARELLQAAVERIKEQGQ